MERDMVVSGDTDRHCIALQMLRWSCSSYRKFETAANKEPLCIGKLQVGL